MPQYNKQRVREVLKRGGGHISEFFEPVVEQNALRLHAKEIIVTKADEALSMYEEMLRQARAKHDDAMVRHWARRIEERKKLMARLKR